MCVHVWLCLVTGGHVWLCVLMCGYVLQGVPMCGYMWLCVAICGEPHPTGPVHPDIVSTSAENSVLEYKKLNIFWGRINCSPIGHNDTNHFLCPIRTQHSLHLLEMVR